MARTKYREEYAQLARWMARAGQTDAEIAKELKCSRSTLANWKKQFPEFAEALGQGKEIVDHMVEDALLKRALGYEYKETKEEREPGENGEMKLLKRTVTTKMVIPDTTAQIFWLKNRDPEHWRDKHDLDVPGGITIVIPKAMVGG